MSLPLDCVEIIARFVASPGREIDDVARDAKNLVRAGHRDMSSAVWARVAAMADSMASFQVEAKDSGCSPSRNADKWDIARLAFAAGIANAHAKPMYRLVEELSESSAPVHPLYCDVPLCVALYVLRMSFRWMPRDRAMLQYGDRNTLHVPGYNGSYLFAALRRAPLKTPGPDWRTASRERVEEFLEKHGIAERPFWVKDHADAGKLIRQRELEKLGLPTFMADWFHDLQNLKERAGNYRDVAEALGDSIEKVFGRRYGDWNKAGRLLIDRSLDRLKGRTDGGIFGFPYVLKPADVARAYSQVDRAIEIIDASGCVCDKEVHVVLGDDETAKVVIGGEPYSLGGSCPP